MRKRRSTKRGGKAFLATPKGQAWLAKKIEEKRSRPSVPAPERLTRTKFPFTATINGREAIVSRNAYGIQIDYPDGPEAVGSRPGSRRSTTAGLTPTEGESDDPQEVQPEMPSGA